MMVRNSSSSDDVARVGNTCSLGRYNFKFIIKNKQVIDFTVSVIPRRIISLVERIYSNTEYV
jgi:hypothetical protein